MIQQKRVAIGSALSVAVIATVAALTTSPVRSPALPDPVKTPGATNASVTQDNLVTTIGKPGWATAIRPDDSYTADLKRKQMAAGYVVSSDTNPADYEEDHLISIELGGSPTDPANLWPEPWHVNVDGFDEGAREKDRAEDALHRAVLAHKISLADAQKAIASDWTAVYRQYVSPQFPAYSPKAAQ